MSIPPTPSVADVESDLRRLVDRERRARLQALMPTLHELSLQGVRQESLAQTLCAGGIPITTPALRKALSRWRKRLKAVVGAPPSVTDFSRLPASSSAPASPETSAGPVTSKADLVRLRQSHQHIDLNQLASYGRKK